MKRIRLAIGTRRGIVLITTLALLIFLVMLSSMLITTAYSALASTTSYYKTDRAYNAAVAGIVLAQACIEGDINFMSTAADTPATGTTTNPGTGFQVTYYGSSDHVHVGLIIGEDDADGVGFRLCFSPNPATYPTEKTDPILGCDYISCNNMGSDAAGNTYQDQNVYEGVQKRSATIICEGYVLGSNNVHESRRIVEVGFYRDMMSIINSVVSSGSDLDVSVNNNFTVNKAGGVSGMPVPRSMTAMNLTDPGGVGMSGWNNQVGDLTLPNNVAGNKATLHDPGPANITTNVDNTTTSAQNNSGQFLPVPYASATTAPVQHIPSGAYVFWPTAGSVTGSAGWNYYPDLNYDPSISTNSYFFDPTTHNIVDVNASDTGVHDPASMPGSLPAGMFNNGTGNGEVDVTKATDVTAQGGNNSVAILAPGISTVTGATIDNNRVTVNFTAASSSDSAVLQNSNGNGSIALRGNINGQGNVIANGNLSFEGQSQLQPDPNTVVSLYASGNASMQPILNLPGAGGSGTTTTGASTGGTGNYQNESFYGLVYTQGNFSAGVADPTTDNISLQGALVAYGNNPTAYNPANPATWPGAGANPGQVQLTAANVTLTYDPTYLGALYSMFPSNAQLLMTYFANY